MHQLSQNITQLIYTSHALPIFLLYRQAQINCILETSVRNNAEVEITGALISHGGWFIQCIEGPEQQLYKLFKEICLDPRHIDVAVIKEGAVMAREFGEWSMCAADLSKVDVKILEKLDLKPDFDPSRCSANLLLALLKTVVGVKKAIGR